MTTYQICDANGYALTDGLTKDEAYRIAQTKANDRGESVWVSGSDSEELGDEVAPADATDDITDEQLTALRAEAAAADDSLQVALCDIALASGLTDIAEIDHAVRGDLERMGIIPEHIGADVRARAECARVIADAQATRD